MYSQVRMSLMSSAPDVPATSTATMSEPALGFSRPLEHRGRGIVLRVGAVTAFGAMMAALKYSTLHGVAPLEILFYRNLFSFPTILAWIVLGGRFATVKTKRPVAHATRSAIG